MIKKAKKRQRKRVPPGCVATKGHIEPWQRDAASDEEFVRGFDSRYPPTETIRPAIEDAEERCKVYESKLRETQDQLAMVMLERNEAWRARRVAEAQVATLLQQLEQWHLFQAMFKQMKNPA